jgi:ParB family chromosome partitioning protein
MAKLSLREYQDQFGKLRSAFHQLNNFGEIDIDDVIADPNGEPREFDQDDLISLGQDIKERGQLAPIRVYWCSKRARWVIIHGERRWRAIQAVGLFRVLCIFLDDEPTENEKISARLVDQLLREDVPPITIAKSFRRLMDINAWSMSELARKLHIGKATASRMLSLLSLPEEIQDAVESGELPPTTAYEITKAPEANQRQLGKQAIEQGMTREETTLSVAQHDQGEPKREAKPQRKGGAKRAIRASNGLTVTVTNKKRFTDEQAIEALREMIDAIQVGKRGVA